MASVPPLPVFAYEEYAAIAASSELRLEFWEGVIFDTPRGSPRHSALCSNITGILSAQLRGSACQVLGSNLRLRSVPAERVTYADVSVVRGPLELDPADASRQTVLNPTLIVEVESHSTADDDRGPKLDCYKLMSSVQAVLLVSQDQRELCLHVRRDDGAWGQTKVTSGVLQLDAISCTLPVDEVYEQLPEA